VSRLIVPSRKLYRPTLAEVAWCTKSAGPAAGDQITVAGGDGPSIEDVRRGLKSERFEFSVPFTKTKAVNIEAKEGDLVLTGYASTWQLDRDGEMVLPGAFQKSMQTYLDSNPVVLWQHNMDWPIGVIKTAEEDETGLLVTAVIPRPPEGAAEWHTSAFALINAGVVRTFSIGGYFWREMADTAGPEGYPIIFIREVEWLETSCVSIPANAGSIFEAAQKSIKGAVREMLPTAAIEQMGQVIGAEPLTHPELILMSDEARREREKYIAGLYARAGLEAPTREEYAELEQRSARLHDVGDVDDAEVLALAGAAAAFMQKLYGNAMLDPDAAEVGAKAGRALSKANQSRLEQAKNLLDEVLAAVADGGDDAEEGEDRAPDAGGAAAGEGETKSLDQKGALSIADLPFRG
jgi:HK97 family phage prohead protease